MPIKNVKFIRDFEKSDLRTPETIPLWGLGPAEDYPMTPKNLKMDLWLKSYSNLIDIF